MLSADEFIAQIRSGALSADDAKKMLETMPFADLDFAKLDLHRAWRKDCPETVFCQNKTPLQVAEIFSVFAEKGQAVLGTRATEQQAGMVQERLPESTFDPVSRILKYGSVPEVPGAGLIAVCTGGTADLPVAEEAAQTAEFAGSPVSRIYDVGVAGLHRLLSRLDDLRRADVIVAVAGMEGALGGVISGLVSAPVIAVPTSVGYGASFEGLAPLLTMLNSCAEGMAVVNIDNGFGAGYFAAQISRLIATKGKCL